MPVLLPFDRGENTPYNVGYAVPVCPCSPRRRSSWASRRRNPLTVGTCSHPQGRVLQHTLAAVRSAPSTWPGSA
jgi:hypothetical protein